MKGGMTSLSLGISFLLFSPTLAAASTLIWGGPPVTPSEIEMVEGGTYAVPLNTPAPAHVTLPSSPPVFDVQGSLYRITGGTRVFVATIASGLFGPASQLSWSEAGTYELDIEPIPPPEVNFEDQLRRWMARILLADTADAQDTPALERLHFTIQELQVKPDPVIIIPGILGSWEHNGVLEIDPILHTYDDLIATLDANGYTPGVDLFPFPYDWRKSNVDTAVLLKQKIDEVKGICNCAKVDLVAHSMGGLVARQYVQSPAYGHDVDQLIFLGTPHLGAPKAYLMWEGGEVGPFLPFSNTLLKKVLELEADEKGFSSLFSYIRNKPITSVQELLPTYDYIFDTNVLRQYPNNYPANSFLQILNSNVGKLYSSGISISNFVGETGTQKTINGLNILLNGQYAPKWEHGYPEGFYDLLGSHGFVLGSGDETVPLASASFVNSNLPLTQYDHNFLPTGVEGEVYNILTGKAAGTLSHNFDSFLEKLLYFAIHSPADLLIVAPDGKKIGKDTNGQEINEITSAFYTGFNTDTEFITILNPLPGQYKVFSQGTGSGPYTVETNLISEATTTETSFTGNTAPGIVSELNLTLSTTTLQPSVTVVVTYKSTLADLDRIYALGWVNVGVYKALQAQLKAAKQVPPFVAKKILQAILKQLEKYRGKTLNELGYQILKADVESLIN